MLISQVQTRLVLPPMGRMMVERLVFDRTGRWPGPALRRVLEVAAGHPLFAAELLRAYQDAGALAETGPDTIEARFELGSRAAGLDEMIRAHLGELDQPARYLVDALAVWGADITEAELAQLLAAPPGRRPANSHPTGRPAARAGHRVRPGPPRTVRDGWLPARSVL